MTNNELQQWEEGNKLIADFMGYGFGWGKFYHRTERSWFKIAKYEHSWDWLMPVVEKINASGIYDVIIFRTTCHINDKDSILFETTHETSKRGSLIADVYEVIVQFIKWHNSQSKTHPQ